ncbi:hypothetical protein O1L55_31770 [Streptomyces albulus]|nr:hypothetical protein [Streptomyces noursei]
METSVQRAVQEALTNVRRHAPGAVTVAVRAALRAGQLAVEVRNDGPVDRAAAPPAAAAASAWSACGSAPRRSAAR